MAYLLYGNSGGICKVKKQVENRENVYTSLLDALKAVADTPLHPYDIEDLSIEDYGYDPRIKKEVYIIVTKRCGRETYSRPQFVSFMVEI